MSHRHDTPAAGLTVGERRFVLSAWRGRKALWKFPLDRVEAYYAQTREMRRRFAPAWTRQMVLWGLIVGASWWLAFTLIVSSPSAASVTWLSPAARAVLAALFPALLGAGIAWAWARARSFERELIDTACPSCAVIDEAESGDGRWRACASCGLRRPSPGGFQSDDGEPISPEQVSLVRSLWNRDERVRSIPFESVLRYWRATRADVPSRKVRAEHPAAMLYLLGIVLAMRWVATPSSVPQSGLRTIAQIAVVILVWIVIIAIFARRVRSELGLVGELTSDNCPRCRYATGGLTVINGWVKCPECGHERPLPRDRIRVVEAGPAPEPGVPDPPPAAPDPGDPKETTIS